MSKRKRASLGKTPAGADQTSAAEDASTSADDAAAKDDMAHVSPDMLSGSPDIFAAKTSVPSVEPEPPVETPIEIPTEAPAATESGPPLSAEATPVEAPSERIEVPSESAHATFVPSAQPPVTTAQMHPMGFAPPPGRPRRAGSSAALGVVLVVVGLFALGVVLFGIDLTTYGWPLFVLIPGLTLLVIGFVGGGQGASIPGGILTVLGLVLAYQSGTGDWASWAFVWALVAPGGVGLGMYLQALRDRDSAALHRGRTLMFAGALIFMIGFVFFESILGISGTTYGIFGKAALPALLIIIGIILLVRSIQRSRRV